MTVYRLLKSVTLSGDGANETHDLYAILAALLAEQSLSAPSGGSYGELLYSISNKTGTEDAYLAVSQDLTGLAGVSVAQVQTVVVTAAADGTWSIGLTAFDGTVILAEFVASGDTEADIADGLRTALTTGVSGHDLTISGAGANVIITATNAGEPFVMGTVTDPGAGTHTSTPTTANATAETAARTNMVIPAGTTPAQALTFGPYPFHDGGSPSLRCIAGAVCLVSIHVAKA